MKIPAGKIDSVITAPPTGVAGFLLYGGNEGLSDARLQTLITYWQQQWRGDFSLQKLAADEIMAQPDSLRQAVCNQGLFARKTLIIIRPARDALTAMIKDVLPHLDVNAVVLILLAVDLDSRSSLRRLAEQHAAFVALPAYEDTPAVRRTLVQSYAAAHGWQLAAPALEYLSHYDVLDRRLLLQDLEKIDLYRGDRLRVTLDDVKAMLDSAEQEKLEERLLQILQGKSIVFEEVLSNHAGGDVTPHRTLRVLQRILYRLLVLKAATTNGESLEAALKQQGIFFKLEPLYRALLARYTADALLNRLQAVLDKEVFSKRQPLMAGTITNRLCLQLNRV